MIGVRYWAKYFLYVTLFSPTRQPERWVPSHLTPDNWEMKCFLRDTASHWWKQDFRALRCDILQATLCCLPGCLPKGSWPGGTLNSASMLQGEAGCCEGRQATSAKSKAICDSHRRWLLSDFSPLGWCKHMMRRMDVQGNFLSARKCSWKQHHESPFWERPTNFLHLKQPWHMQIKLVIHLQSSSFQIPNWEMLIRNYGVFVILGGALHMMFSAHSIPVNKLSRLLFLFQKIWWASEALHSSLRSKIKARMGRQLVFLLFSLLFNSTCTWGRSVGSHYLVSEKATLHHR